MKPLVYAPAALADLQSIALYISDDDPDRALTFVAELEIKAALAIERPRSFPSRGDLASGLRSILHRRYLILFRDLEDQVRIERVLHGSRDLRGIRID